MTGSRGGPGSDSPRSGGAGPRVPEPYRALRDSPAGPGPSPTPLLQAPEPWKVYMDCLDGRGVILKGTAQTEDWAERIAAMYRRLDYRPEVRYEP